MAPKKLIDHLRVSRQSPLHADLEEGNYSEAESNSPLNQEGPLNPTFDPIVASLCGKKKRQALSSSNNKNSEAGALDNLILDRQERHDKHLQQIFSLVSSIGSEVRSVVKAVVAESESHRIKDDKTKSGSAQKETRKAASRNISFADLEEDDMEIKDDDNNNDGGNNDDDDYDVDDYVSHSFYMNRIAEGFDKRAPSRLASSKPAH